MTSLFTEWQKVVPSLVFVSCLCLLSSCLHVEPNLETSQNVRNSIKKLIELSGGQGEIDLIIGVVILYMYNLLQDILQLKGKKSSFSIHWIGLHSQLESEVLLLKINY